MFSSLCSFDVVSYFDGIFVLSLKGEESLNKLLTESDPDHLGGPTQGYNNVKKSSQSE